MKYLAAVLVPALVAGVAYANPANLLWRPPPRPSGTVQVNVTSSAFGPSVPVDDPTFCFGENGLGECVLFFGSEQACENVTPCLDSSAPSRDRVAAAIGQATLGGRDATFCYGLDPFDRCTLFLGSEQACESLRPCSVGLQLPADR